MSLEGCPTYRAKPDGCSERSVSGTRKRKAAYCSFSSMFLCNPLPEDSALAIKVSNLKMTDVTVDSSPASQAGSMRMPHEFSSIDVLAVHKNSNSNINIDDSGERNPPPLPPPSTRPNEPVASLCPPPALPPRPRSRSGVRSPVTPLEPNEIICDRDINEQDEAAEFDLGPPVPALGDLVCAVCMAPTTRHCSRCKLEGYCEREHQVLVRII